MWRGYGRGRGRGRGYGHDHGRDRVRVHARYLLRVARRSRLPKPWVRSLQEIGSHQCLVQWQ